MIRARAPARKPVFYRPELDALRFAAFLFVFSHHAMFILDATRYTGLKAKIASVECAVREQMAFGVPLFFFLSAFLITTLLLKERAETGSVHIRSFYLRRILRIWPLYFTYIFGCLMVGWIFHKHTPKGEIFALLFLMGNWYAGHYDRQCAAAFVVLWSISVEEQFYLVWPGLAKYSRRWVLFGLCALFALISFSVVFRLKAGEVWDFGIWTNSFAQLQFFAFGGALALLLGNRIFHASKLVRMSLVLAGCICWLGSKARPVVPAGALAMAFGYLLVAVGCVCFFLSVYGIEARALPRWLAYLGKISYGLYIFHVLPLHLAWRIDARLGPASLGVRLTRTFLLDSLALLATIAIAAISYRYLEKPWLLLKQQYEYINTKTVWSDAAKVDNKNSLRGFGSKSASSDRI